MLSSEIREAATGWKGSGCVFETRAMKRLCTVLYCTVCMYVFVCMYVCMRACMHVMYYVCIDVYVNLVTMRSG